MVSEEIILILTFLAEAIMVLLCLHISFNRKFKFDLYMLGFCVIDCAVFYLVTKNMLPIVCSVIVYLLAGAYCFIEFKEKFWSTILRCVVAIVILGILETGITCIAVPLKNVIETRRLLLLLTMVSDIIAFIIYLFGRKRHVSIRNSKKLIGIIVLYMIVLSGMIIDYNIQGSIINLYFICVFTFLLLVYIFVDKVEVASYEIESKNKELQLQQTYGNAYEELLDHVRKRQHDYKNQISALYSMRMTADSMETLASMQDEYLNGLAENDKFNSILTCCNNPILAGFIYNKCVQFDSNNIDVEYNLKVDQGSVWEPLHELIELLGIFFDNALEHILLEESNEGKLSFMLYEDEKNLHFSISNPAPYLTSKEIEQIFAQGYSTKGKNRGIGLSRAIELIAKNNATIQVKNIEKDGQNWINFEIVKTK